MTYTPSYKLLAHPKFLQAIVTILHIYCNCISILYKIIKPNSFFFLTFRGLPERQVLQVHLDPLDHQLLPWRICLEALRITMLVLLLLNSQRMRLCLNLIQQTCSKPTQESRPPLRLSAAKSIACAALMVVRNTLLAHVRTLSSAIRWKRAVSQPQGHALYYQTIESFFFNNIIVQVPVYIL